MIGYSRALVTVTVLALATIVAGCGNTNAESAVSSSHARHVTATTVALPHHLSNTQWYPPAVTKHFSTTGMAYLVPNSDGLQSWSGNPTNAVLITLNHLRQATTVKQVEEYSDPSLWPQIPHVWQFPKPHSRWYHRDTEPLTVQNVGSMPAAQSPYANFIKTHEGTDLLQHFWVLAVANPGHSFATWIKTHPALTPWYYFVNVRGHWLLYSIQN